MAEIALSFALVRQMQAMVTGITADGQLAEHVANRANQMEKIPEAKRRFI